MDDDWAALVERINRLVDGLHANESDIARRAKISPSTINRWRGGIYSGRRSTYQAALRAVAEMEAEAGLPSLEEDRLFRDLAALFDEEQVRAARTLLTKRRTTAERGDPPLNDPAGPPALPPRRPR